MSGQAEQAKRAEVESIDVIVTSAITLKLSEHIDSYKWEPPTYNRKVDVAPPAHEALSRKEVQDYFARLQGLEGNLYSLSELLELVKPDFGNVPANTELTGGTEGFYSFEIDHDAKNRAVRVKLKGHEIRSYTDGENKKSTPFSRELATVFEIRYELKISAL